MTTPPARLSRLVQEKREDVALALSKFLQIGMKYDRMGGPEKVLPVRGASGSRSPAAPQADFYGGNSGSHQRRSKSSD